MLLRRHINSRHQFHTHFLAILRHIKHLRGIGTGAFTGRLLATVLKALVAMIMAIVLAAYFLNFVMSAIGLTGKVNTLITSLGLGPYELLAVVVLFYLVLGMFMETLSMMVATVPIVTPVVVAAGFDPVWFGVVVMLLMELAMITPPVGINLYVVQGLRKRGKIDDVIIGAAPFVLAIMATVAVLAWFPQLALWLPGTMR